MAMNHRMPTMLGNKLSMMDHSITSFDIVFVVRNVNFDHGQSQKDIGPVLQHNGTARNLVVCRGQSRFSRVDPSQAYCCVGNASDDQLISGRVSMSMAMTLASLPFLSEKRRGV
jgi:hypothetical protein